MAKRRIVSTQVAEQFFKFNEYKRNPIKWMEECVYIPEAGGDTLIKLYEPQKKVIQSFFDKHHLILLKSRQTGFSTISQILIAYLCTFYENVICGLTSRSGDEASDFCRKVQNILTKQPLYLRPSFTKCSEQSFITATGNQLWSSPVSPSNPAGLFRGKAITLLIVDEAAFIRDIEEAWTAAAMTLSKTQKVAYKKDIPYGTIILSTPNKINGIGKFFYNMWTSAINNEDIENRFFSPHRIHWTEIPDFVNDPGWYKSQCDILNNDSRKIAQELELKFISSENSMFSEKVQEELQNKNKEPEEKIMIAPGVDLWKFKQINPKKFHIIGVDCASAAGHDYSAVQVMEFTTMQQVLELKVKMEPKHFSKHVKTIAQMVPHNIIVVENTGGYGVAVLNELTEDENHDYNVYGNWRGGSGTRKELIPGLNTNIKTRPLIIDALFTTVTEDPTLISSFRLAYELLALTTKSNNKIEADKGFNDDLAMAYGFCCYVRKYEATLLGNIDDLDKTDDFKDTIFLQESSSYIAGLNDDTSPLKSEYENSEDFGHFKKVLDNTLFDQEQFRKVVDTHGKGLNNGNLNVINTISLFRR